MWSTRAERGTRTEIREQVAEERAREKRKREREKWRKTEDSEGVPGWASVGWDKKPLPSGRRLLKPYHYGIHSSVSSPALLFHYIVCAANEITAISRRAGRHGATMLRCSTTQPPPSLFARLPPSLLLHAPSRSFDHLLQRIPGHVAKRKIFSPPAMSRFRSCYRMLVNYGHYGERRVMSGDRCVIAIVGILTPIMRIIDILWELCRW